VRRGRLNAVGPGELIHIHDRSTQQRYLVDTGATYSILPFSSPAIPSGPLLVGPDGRQIKCWGRRRVHLEFGRRRFVWSFLLAAVKFPIIGVDFLKHYRLLVDPANNRLLACPPSTPPAATAGYQTVAAAATPPATCGAGATVTQVATCGDTALVDQFAKSFPAVFGKAAAEVKVKHDVEHFLVTTGPPISSKFRRLDGEKLAAAKEEFSKMEAEGIVRRSTSPWASPLHMVQKPDGSWRPCGDFRRLNLVTQVDSYPLPNMLDFSANVANCRWFSKIDLRKGYYQIPMNKADIPKTAVATPFGLYEFTRMPFGLRNAGSTFQRLMDRVLSGLPFSFCYLDDIIVASKEREPHLHHLQLLFERLDAAGLVVNPDKCTLAVNEIDFLGHKITAAGVQPLPDHVAAIEDYPPPTNIKELQAFLGIINFYRRFVPGAARVLLPLTECLRGGKAAKEPILWSAAMTAAFTAAKKAVSAATLLAHPVAGAQLALAVDASDQHVGAVLQQKAANGDAWRPLGFFSKKLEPAQTRYSTFDRELYACFAAIRHFRYMLEGRPFIIFTDHKPLTYAVARTSDPWTGRQARQLAYIAEFTSDIRHIAGKENIVADALSRPPTGASPNAQPVAAVAASEAVLDYGGIAARQQLCAETQQAASSSSLIIKPVELNGVTLWCDMSTGTPRPVIPKEDRRQVFAAFHTLAHPGIRATRRLLAARVVWPKMAADIGQWCRDCQECGRSKVTRQPAAAIEPIPVPRHRFSHIHVDLVGPLPVSAEGYTYLFTVIDRSTRWLEAVPVKNMEARTCADALVNTWVSRFGVPAVVTSDRGTQFCSAVWEVLCKTLNINHITTTAFHPQSNGMLERAHRQLKDALRARLAGPEWPQHLPWVLLGLRAAPKEESAISSAELVYGAPLTLPGQLRSAEELPAETFVQQLREVVPPPTRARPIADKVAADPKLMAARYVYVRRGGKAPPLMPVYQGPYEVITAGPKYFLINVGGKPDTVSVDRLPHLGPAPVVPAEPAVRGRPKLVSSLASSGSVQPLQVSASEVWTGGGPCGGPKK
jgi:transposase InsO family protein